MNNTECKQKLEEAMKKAIEKLNSPYRGDLTGPSKTLSAITYDYESNNAFDAEEILKDALLAYGGPDTPDEPFEEQRDNQDTD